MPFVFVSTNHHELSIICRNGLDLDLICFETFLLISYFTSEIKIKKLFETKVFIYNNWLLIVIKGIFVTLEVLFIIKGLRCHYKNIDNFKLGGGVEKCPNLKSKENFETKYVRIIISSRTQIKMSRILHYNHSAF